MYFNAIQTSLAVSVSEGKSKDSKNAPGKSVKLDVYY